MIFLHIYSMYGVLSLYIAKKSGLIEDYDYICCRRFGFQVFLPQTVQQNRSPSYTRPLKGNDSDYNHIQGDFTLV